MLVGNKEAECQGTGFQNSDSSTFPSLVVDFPFAELSLTQTFDQPRAPSDELGLWAAEV